MRIRTLRFGNLNSLAGVWEIDFTHPDYVSSGIFAITGPTGAGKSTILDAVCLSLYGQTPRLGRITQSANEIMSRRTGECFSEVEFETAMGCFRCHWSQHRSRRKPDGQLQSPRHEIAEAEGGAILESGLTTVVKKVEEVTGMDFQRFTRSMLLAQGGFAAFLQARPDERAPILEQITGTEIYSRISMKVHELTSEERRKLEALRLELEGMKLLSAEEEHLLRNELDGMERLEAELGESVRQLRLQREWRERITALETELARLEEAWQAFLTRREGAAPELERLALGRRALSLDADHARIEAVRDRQRLEQQELAAARARLPETRRSHRDAEEALKGAERELGDLLTEQTAQSELFRATRELDLKLKGAVSRAKELEEEISGLGKRCDAFRGTVAACDARIGEDSRALRLVADLLATHAADAGLAEAMTGIEHRAASLREQEKRLAERNGELKRQTKAWEEAGEAREQAERELEEARQSAAELEGQLGGIRECVATLLRGRGLEHWREEAESYAARLGLLRTMQESLAGIGESALKLAGLRKRLEILEHDRLELARQEKELAGESLLREEMAGQLQERVVLLNRVRDLEAERERLVDGAPCPLCGATVHPYAGGNLPRPDEAERELEQARAMALDTGNRLASARAGLAAGIREREQVERELGERRELLDREESRFNALCAGLGLDVVQEPRAETVANLAEAYAGELENRSALIREVDRRREEERGVMESRDRATELLSELEKKCQAAALGREYAESGRKRLELECSALADDLYGSLAALGRDVEAYGWGDLTLAACEAMLNDLVKRRAVHQERVRERERLEKRLSGFAAEKLRQETLLTETEDNLAERETLLGEAVARRDELATGRRELFGDRDPDAEERRLTRMRELAAEKRDRAAQEHTRLRTELAGLEDGMERLSASVKTRAEELAGLETVLLRRISAEGFADENAYLRARLTGEWLEELTRLAEELRRAEAEILARRADRAAAIRQEREKKLTDKPLELIREEAATLDLRLGELRKELGALAHRLRQHEDERELRKSRLQAMERQREECARWELLHNLIGSGDGKKFRNFAQGLTFELMVAHANAQLRKMNDRYILVRDQNEPLELNVMDNYQAGEIRSTKNLSGGESFIVSLALSLGLSCMASRNVRIDSLFLDEGFGTLDEGALETALETLSGLQREGKLIGLISHVPALRERIGARIRVESGSAGRSALDGPGCRRIG